MRAKRDPEKTFLLRLYTQVSVSQYERVTEFAERTGTPIATILCDGALRLIAEKEKAA